MPIQISQKKTCHISVSRNFPMNLLESSMSIQVHPQPSYPRVNVYMWKITIFNGYIHKWAMASTVTLPIWVPKISPFSQPRCNVHAVHQATRCCRHQSTRSLPAERQHLSAKWSDLALKYTEIMGVKQCHKSHMTGIGNHTTYKNGDDWGWFIIVYIKWWTRGWLFIVL